MVSIAWTPKRYRNFNGYGRTAEEVAREMTEVFKGFPEWISRDDIPKLEILQAMVGDVYAHNNPYTQMIAALSHYPEIKIWVTDEPTE